MLMQEYGNDTPRPFWAQQWTGGLALSRYVLDNPDMVRNKHVVDFCSGSGIVGIAAAIAGATIVTCVDNDLIALSSSLLNARANKVSVSVSEKIIEGDVVLAGDPKIDSFVFDILQQTDCYIGCPVRNKDYLSGFDVVHSYNINTEEFPNGVDTFIIKQDRTTSAHFQTIC